MFFQDLNIELPKTELTILKIVLQLWVQKFGTILMFSSTTFKNIYWQRDH